MATYSEIIARAETLAQGKANDPSKSVVIDGTMTAEAIYPHALRWCIAQMLRRGDNLGEVSQDNNIEIVDGEGVVPDEIIGSFLSSNAFIVNNKYASWLGHEDYIRPRYDNLVCYFSARNGQFFYSCDVPTLVRTMKNGSISGDLLIGTNFVAADVGRRIRLMSTDGTILHIDAIVDEVLDDATVRMRGESLVDSLGADNIPVYETRYDAVSRSLTTVGTTAGDATVTCAGGAFTASDVGRRLRVMNGSTPVVDAIITTINSGTSVEVAAKALTTQAAATADVMFSPVIVNCPTVPALPADPDDLVDLPETLVENVIITIAAALCGEIPLIQLQENKQ